MQPRREKERLYGNGRWPRKQLYAIVATYWARGEEVWYVAVKLGISRKHAKQIFDYFESCEMRPPGEGEAGTS